jgi:hypothetical protein
MKNHGHLPPHGEQVIVYCMGFKCLGRYDADHRWRGVFSREVLSDVIGWSPVGTDEMISVSQTQQEDIPERSFLLERLDLDAPLMHGAIKINLLAEAQEAEELRLKNPVKRAVWIAGFFVSVVLIWMIKVGLDIHFTQSDYTNTEKRIAEIEAQYAKATNDLINITQKNLKIASLDRLATNRFLWAPLLGALEGTMVDHIQVIRLAGNQTYTQEAARTIGHGSSKKEIPGGILERISLNIEARDTSTDDQAWNNYKDRLDRCDYFVKTLKSPNGFVLGGILRIPVTDPSDPSGKFSTFSLDAHFPEARHSE